MLPSAEGSIICQHGEVTNRFRTLLLLMFVSVTTLPHTTGSKNCARKRHQFDGADSFVGAAIDQLQQRQEEFRAEHPPFGCRYP